MEERERGDKKKGQCCFGEEIEREAKRVFLRGWEEAPEVVDFFIPGTSATFHYTPFKPYESFTLRQDRCLDSEMK